MEENKKELFDIDTSVMYILGISESLFDFQLLVQIKACFERKQYSVAIVTDMEMEEEKEDIYSVYDYFSPELSSENLIKANHYIKEIELNKEYDLFLVGMKKGFRFIRKRNSGRFRTFCLRNFKNPSSGLCFITGFLGRLSGDRFT